MANRRRYIGILVLTIPDHLVQVRDSSRQAFEREKKNGGDDSEEVGGTGL